MNQKLIGYVVWDFADNTAMTRSYAREGDAQRWITANVYSAKSNRYGVKPVYVEVEV
jgi:hypothetical protein